MKHLPLVAIAATGAGLSIFCGALLALALSPAPKHFEPPADTPAPKLTYSDIYRVGGAPASSPDTDAQARGERVISEIGK